ncbi:MAG: hypothetical protein ACTHOH_04475, partial [Lysobacteraceae bacterium]
MARAVGGFQRRLHRRAAQRDPRRRRQRQPIAALDAPTCLKNVGLKNVGPTGKPDGKDLTTIAAP